ncbi:MAG: nitrilase-related carbon-nitrogen hydrolase [Acidobacteriota bacterium]|nr:nitrilase-related carbon-nitrogen hydrolase [Acidobacteriota bacterium]
MGGSRGGLEGRPGPWRRRLESVGISLLGALALWVGARFESTGPLIGVGFTLLLMPSLLERWRAPLWGFVPGAMLYAWVINGTLVQFAWYAPLLVVPLLGWHYVLMPLMTRTLVLLTRGPAWFVLPLAMGAEEWLRPHLGLGHYSMYKTGTFLYQWPVVIQVAEFVGALGLTVLYALLLGALVEWVRWGIDGPGFTSPRRVMIGGVLAAVVVVGVCGYGVWRLETLEKRPGPRLALVQPSQDHGFDETPRVVQVQQSMTAAMVPAGAADLLVWPENAILTPYELSQTYQDVVSWLVRAKEAPLLFGTQDVGRSGRPAALAVLADGDGEIVGRYRKMVLFPFTERRILPWLEHVLPAASDAIVDLTRQAWGSAADGRAGEEVALLSLEVAGETWRFWTPLCYDSCFAGYARDAAAGARASSST